jgi:leader peptidase (prepilin peptidase)/N-methyltransferase
MGFGDFKLLAALGAWTGWQVLPLVVLVSASVGAVGGLIGMALSGKGRDTRIPFGPYLAFGGLVALLWGHAAVVAYLGYFPK